jgi:peroxiredoxin
MNRVLTRSSAINVPLPGVAMLRVKIVALLLLQPCIAMAVVAPSPQEVQPVLVGSAAPDAPLRTLDDQATTLHAQLAGKPTVLVFYRGGWCPYCNLQLSELRHLTPELARNGFQLIALSPDRPLELAKTLDKQALEYTLLSDSSATAMQQFGIAFRVDDATAVKYADYGIDLAAASGESHRALPVASVFVIDAKGMIAFSYVNPDYRTRVPVRILRAAVEAVAAGEAGKPLK